jgi:hypothetical protein
VHIVWLGMDAAHGESGDRTGMELAVKERLYCVRLSRGVCVGVDREIS